MELKDPRNTTRMDYSLKNGNYELVLAVINDRLKDMNGNFCSCPRCLQDIAATALNMLPPHYFVVPGEGQEAGSPLIMVEAAVREAMERVKENQGHQRSSRHGSADGHTRREA